MSAPEEINRRKFMSSLGILGVAGACPAKSFSAGTFPVKDQLTILKAGPYLQSPARSNETFFPPKRPAYFKALGFPCMVVITGGAFKVKLAEEHLVPSFNVSSNKGAALKRTC
ncbi:MAG: hypothetical protein V4553_00515 [Bacteroidota bacterium]